MTFRVFLLAGAVSFLAPGAYAAPKASAVSATTAPPALVEMVRDFTIPFETFTLPNGLRVIVLTDRRLPMVYTAVWYDIGSTGEPANRSGFAHLFEHLMFNGSENVPGDYFTHLRDAGLIGINGGTSYDFTQYYEAVPTGSLDRVLFMESDRMGHLLGAVTQGVLDEQRGVVQNEKRNGDNNPGSILGYRQREALYPAGHPYGHSIIGSMKDLNAASLADVHSWFKDHYGPNNATLILAGDIDLATASAKVKEYFGDIARGKENVVPVSPVSKLAKPVTEVLTAPVTDTTIIRTWPVPGVTDDENFALDAASGLMAGIDSAPLTEKLVRQDKLFSSVSVNNSTFRGVGELSVQARVRSGVDPKIAAKALDAAIADFLRNGVSKDTLQRWQSATIIPMVAQQEPVESRAARLIQSAMSRGSAAAYKADLEAYLRLTPARVMEVARKWLTRPNYRAMLVPGARMTPPGDESVEGPASAVPPAPPAPAAAVVPAKTDTRGSLPGIGEPGEVEFPRIERATLTNGIPVVYVPAENVPFTQLDIAFPVGSADDPVNKPNLVNWTFQMLSKGAAGHDDHWFAQQQERTGIEVGGGAMQDRSSISVNTPSASIDQALATTMMILTRPDYPSDRLEDLRRQTLSYVNGAPTNVGMLANKVFSEALAPGSAYARNAQIDTPAAIGSVTRDDLVASFDRWIRPQQAEIMVSSSEPLATLLPKLDATLGLWSSTSKAPMGKPPARIAARKSGRPRIVLIDMPDAVQATITGGQLLAIPYGEEALAAKVGNLALGDGFLSRINMNLREDKHWSYGASGGFMIDRFQSSYVVQTQVQPDKVGPAIAEVRKELRDVLSSRPVTQAEFDQAVADLLRKQVGEFRINAQVVGAVRRNLDQGRPDDFLDQFDDRVRALTLTDVNAALREQLDPSKWVWTIAGNAKVIRPQLESLKLPVDVFTPAEVIADKGTVKPNAPNVRALQIGSEDAPTAQAR